MSKSSFEVWGRTLDLEVIFDCYSGEEVLPVQKEALKAFSDSVQSIFATAREVVERYCLENNGNEIGTESIENIYKYVKPKAIFIKRSSHSDRVIAIICAYKFNPDDGIAIVFKNETFSAIGTENIIL